MLSWLVAVAVSAALWIAGDGSSLTNGFPTLEELIRNGSLLERYSTHDGEMKSVPGVSVRSNCSGSSTRISKITFIALPHLEPGGGVTDRATQIVMRNDGGAGGRPHVILTIGETITPTFGEFGYELNVPVPPNTNIMFNDGDVLWIRHRRSGLRLLHQVGDEERDTCCRFESETNPPNFDEICEPDYDYPLLAIETDPPGCIEGLVSASELRRLWENRTLPVLYSSPVREIPLNCPSGSISRILVGAYPSVNGDELPEIMVDNIQTCSVSTEPVAEGVNVYECVLDSPVAVDGEVSLTVSQRHAGSQIGFLHTGQTDTPLISLDISGDCSSSQLLSEPDLTEMTALYIPHIIEREDDEIEFEDLTITQNGVLVSWTFVARDIGEGEEYPNLTILIIPAFTGTAFTQKKIENNDCTETPYANVYECSVTPEPVEAGDIIGIALPAYSSARLLLSFLSINGGPIGKSLVGNADLEGVPLITLGVVPNSATTSSTSMQPNPTTKSSSSVIITGSPTQSTTSETPPTEETSDPQSSSDNTGVIVGAVMGLILAVLLFLAVVLLLVFILCRRKHTKYDEKEEEQREMTEEERAAMDNPVYSGGRDTESGRPEDRGSNHQYEVTASQQPSSSTNSGQVYEVPDKNPSSSDGRKINESFDNPGYYSTIHEVHSTTDNSQIDALLSSNHYEMAIYVPTQEQRNYVESGAVPTENIYATLEESQAGNEGRTLSFFEECETYWRPASNKEDLYQQLSQRKYREIPKHQIRITEHLGSGQFGTVNKGVWQRGGEGGVVEVAVKMLQEGTSEQDTVRFLQEAAINGQFRHANIVQLLGVVTVAKPVMIVLELVSNGDLRGYLLKHKPTPGELPPPETGGVLSQFCVQVARGMEYLSGKAFVHRDLAARNILITDSKTCKISDFGMARDLEEGTYYISHGGKVPVKWTAPEALHYKKYSTASDVWSFGCLVYEIWSLGHKPFEGYTNPDTLKLIDNGCRLAPPPGCPLEMYRLMITCWNADKSGRPQFREIVETLSQPESLLLHIPEEVTRGHPQASVLGAPLEAGRNLYTELQNTYMQ